jgi:hypothetical protein
MIPVQHLAFAALLQDSASNKSDISHPALPGLVHFHHLALRGRRCLSG